MKNFDELDEAADFIIHYRLPFVQYQFCTKEQYEQEYRWMNDLKGYTAPTPPFENDRIIGVLIYRGITFNFIETTPRNATSNDK